MQEPDVLAQLLFEGMESPGLINGETVMRELHYRLWWKKNDALPAPRMVGGCLPDGRPYLFTQYLLPDLLPDGLELLSPLIGLREIGDAGLRARLEEAVRS